MSTNKPVMLDDYVPTLEFVLRIELDLPRFLESLGSYAGMGERKMMAVDGGRFEGPDMRGIILPGGSEWPLIRPDGVGTVDARYTLQTDDGVKINIRNTGYRWGPPEVMKVLDAKQELVDPRTYYLRCYTVFEAPQGSRYEWMSRHVFVGVGERHPRANYFNYYKLA